MAKFKQSLRNALSIFMQFVAGREENTEERPVPTQRNQYFT